MGQIHINLSVSLCDRFIIIVTDFNFRTLWNENISPFQKIQNIKLLSQQLQS